MVFTTNGTQEFTELFETRYFAFPKPVDLIKKLVLQATDENDVIMDFFAGSGTTSQAIMEINSETNKQLKFVLVQLPEKIEESSEAFKAGYTSISDISKERIRRVIKKIEAQIIEKKKKKETEIDFEGGDKSTNSNVDLGFRSFKLTPSNFKIWRGNEITEDNLVQQLDAFTDPVSEGSEDQNMLYELIIKAGYQLTDKVESKGNYYAINNGELIIGLKEVSVKVIDDIIAAKPKKVITLDSVFSGNDQLKTNTVLQMKDKGIDFKTI